MNMETGGFGGDDRRKYIVPALIVAAALVVLLLILGIGAILRNRGSGAAATATVTRTATRPVIIGGSPTAAATRTTGLTSSAPSISDTAFKASKKRLLPFRQCLLRIVKTESSIKKIPKMRGFVAWRDSK